MNTLHVAVARSCLIAALVCSAATAAHADSRVRIYNRSSYDVYTINVAPTYRRYFGQQDVLGDTILRAGYNVLLDFDVQDAENECVLDILARTKSSVNREWRRRLNVCQATEYTLVD